MKTSVYLPDVITYDDLPGVYSCDENVAAGFREAQLMGNFYTNITLKTADHQKVIEMLKTEDINAYAALAQDKYVCVFPADDGAMFDMARRMSETFKCAALAAMNHDDDILIFQLYESGTLLDEYNSSPGYFSGNKEEKMGGDADKLCDIFAPDANRAQLADILKRDHTFEVERHHAIVNLLGLPRCTVGSGFAYIVQRDAPLAGIDANTLVRTGSGVDAEGGILAGPHSKSGNPLSGKANSLLEALQSPDGMKKLMEQAQKTAEAHKNEIMDIKIEARGGGGAIIIRTQGNMQITSVEIQENALVPEHVALLEVLVLDALNDAASKTHEQMRQVNMKIMAGGFGF